MYIFLSALCLLTMDIPSTHSQAQVPVGYPNLGAAISSLATCISNNLQTSKVLAPYNSFTVDNPSNLIFRVATNFLTTAGICNPQLAQNNAESANRAGPLTSKLFFDTVGFINANMMASKGLVSADNADGICIRFVSAIELDACASGPTDILSMMNSVTSGSFAVYQDFGLSDQQSMTAVFNLFDVGIMSLKSNYAIELGYDVQLLQG